MDEMDRGRKAPQKRPNLLVRLLAFLVTAALVVGAVFLVANYDKLNFDALKRWFAYRDLERSESGESASFTFEGGSGSAFGLLGGDLLVCSGTEIRLYSDSGQVYVDRTVSMEAPVVSTAGNAALVYDVGGTALFVYRDREEGFSLEERPFRPHLTLARRLSLPGGWTPGLETLLPPTPWRVERLDLMESTRREGRLRYRSLQSFPLAGG